MPVKYAVYKRGAGPIVPRENMDKEPVVARIRRLAERFFAGNRQDAG